MVKEEKANWQEINQNNVINDPGANEDLLVIETDFETKVEEIVIAAEEANWFEVIIRDHDTNNPETYRRYRLDADGQIEVSKSFDDPIFTFGADKEIAIQSITDGGAVDYTASLKLWERRG